MKVYNIDKMPALLEYGGQIVNMDHVISVVKQDFCLVFTMTKGTVTVAFDSEEVMEYAYSIITNKTANPHASLKNHVKKAKEIELSQAVVCP